MIPTGQQTTVASKATGNWCQNGVEGAGAVVRTAMGRLAQLTASILGSRFTGTSGRRAGDGSPGRLLRAGDAGAEVPHSSVPMSSSPPASAANLPIFVTRQTCKRLLGLEWRPTLRAARRLNVAVVIVGRQACFSPGEFLEAVRERAALMRLSAQAETNAAPACVEVRSHLSAPMPPRRGSDEAQ